MLFRYFLLTFICVQEMCIFPKFPVIFLICMRKYSENCMQQFSFEKVKCLKKYFSSPDKLRSFMPETTNCCTLTQNGSILNFTFLKMSTLRDLDRGELIFFYSKIRINAHDLLTKIIPALLQLWETKKYNLRCH